MTKRICLDKVLKISFTITLEHSRVQKPKASQQKNQDKVGGKKARGLVVRHGWAVLTGQETPEN